MDLASLIKKFKDKERGNEEPLRLSFAFATTQAIDLAEEKPMSHGIKLTFLSLAAATHLVNDEITLLTVFYSSIFHDIAIVPLRKKLFFWDKKIYKLWNIHKKEGYSSFKRKLELSLSHEEKGTWNSIVHNTIAEIEKAINIYGVREDVVEHLKDFFSQRYEGKSLPSPVYTIVNLSEKILHKIDDDKRRREEVIEWLKSQYQNYDYEVISTIHNLLEDDDFFELLFEGEIEEEIIRMKPPEARDYFLDRDDIKDLFVYLEELWFDPGIPHARRVEKMLRDFAKSLYLSPDDTEKLSLAAGTHDIGKLHIPPEILYSKRKLTRPQVRVVHRHPYYSEMIINKISGMEEIAEISGKHHEFLDCTGYWRGICSEEINFFTRALTIADIFEALTSPRPFRKALTPRKAISLMEKEFSDKIDRDIFEHFKKFVLQG